MAREGEEYVVKFGMSKSERKILGRRSKPSGSTWPRRKLTSKSPKYTQLDEIFSQDATATGRPGSFRQSSIETVSRGSSLDSAFYDVDETNESNVRPEDEHGFSEESSDKGALIGSWWMGLLKGLQFLLIVERQNAIKSIQDLKKRLTSANDRVKQHEAKLRRILSKLAHLDSDVYDLQDPKDLRYLHQNWKDLYDEIEAWLGGPDAAMTSDSSDTE